MEKLSTFIVKHRKLIALCFLALAIFSVFSTSWVNIEEEITEYLPDTAAAKQGLNVMNQELEMYASGSALVRNISQDDAEQLGNKLSELNGVLQVDFDADSESYWKDDYAKYAITFSGPASDQSAINGKDNLEAALADFDATVISDSFTNYSDTLTEQMGGVLILVAILVVIILILTSTTFAEVPVFLITFIAAALINMGTNFFMGTISFVSNAVAIVLQLALSVDYAIIFCNRYKEEHETRDTTEAVQVALAQSIPAITASSLTTIAGLAAMAFMQFLLGRDMSIALIKSIVISLLTVFLLMPFLLCAFGKWMDRTKHKSFIPKVDFLGKFAYATRFVIPPIFVIIAIFAAVSFGNVQYDFDGNLVNIFNETETRATEREMAEIFGDDYTVALLVPSEDYEKEASLVSDFEETDGVTEVTSIATIEAIDGYRLGDEVSVSQFMKLSDMDETSTKALFAYYAAENGDVDNLNLATYKAPLIKLLLCAHELTQNGQVELTAAERDMIDDSYEQLDQALDQLQGDNYSCIVIKNNYPVQGQETYDFLDNLLVQARSCYGTDDVYITGDQVSAQGFESTFSSDTQLVSILSVILVMLILLLTFRSIAMPVLLIIVIEGSILINFSLAAWTHSYVFFMTYLIVSSIQMGANIDYAIVISTRYSEMRKQDMAPRDAIIKTLNLAFPTVLTSGTMMVFSGAMIALRISDEVIAGMGQFVATGTLITLVLVNFVLPQILLLGDRVVQLTTIHVHATPQVKRIGRAASAFVLAAAAVFALATPLVLSGSITNTANDTISTAEDMKQLAVDLSDIASEVDGTDKASIQYRYAEQLVTDEVGSKQLSDGQTQYDEGKEAIDSANAELSAGEQEYQDSLAEYNEGQQELIDGKTAYDEASATLNAAKAEYAAGEQQLADARAQYAEGQATIEAAKANYAAGEQQLADAQAKYDAGQAQLDEITPIYNVVYPLYENYLELQEEYEQAILDGEYARAAVLYIEVQAAETLFHAQLDTSGYTLEQLIQEYQAGQAELAEGAAEIAAGQAALNAAAIEIADGEAQLADAKAQIDSSQAQLDDAAAQIAQGEQDLADAQAELDDGYAQLLSAEQQLSAARSELDSGYAEVADGETELAEASNQLEEGKKTLATNKQKLSESIADINSLTDDNEKLLRGTMLLQSFSGVTKIAGTHASYSEVCSAAEQYFDKLIADQQSETNRAWATLIALAIMALCGIVALPLSLRRRGNASRWPAFICGIGSVVCALAWNTTTSFGSVPLVAAILLALTAFLFVICNTRVVAYGKHAK